MKKNKEVIKSKSNIKLSRLFIFLKFGNESDSLSEQEVKLVLYKLNIKFFWESEKIAFNIEIKRRILNNNDNLLFYYILDE